MSTLTHPVRYRAAPVAARRPMLAEPGVRFALAHAGLVVAALVVAAAGVGVASALVVLVVVGALLGIGLDPRWTAAVGVSAWAIVTGFVEHDLGRLTLAGPDLARLVLAVAGCALVGLLPMVRAGRLTG